MSELSSKSRALLDAARSARPAPTARNRIGVELAARLGVAALAGPLHVSMAPPPSVVPPTPPIPPTLVPPVPPVPAALVPGPLVGAATTVSIAKGVVAIGALLSCIGVGVLATRPSGPSHSPPTTHSVAQPSPSPKTKSHAVAERVAPLPPADVEPAATPEALSTHTAEIAALPAPIASVNTEVAPRALPDVHAPDAPERLAPPTASAIAKRAAHPALAHVGAKEGDSSIADGASETSSPPAKISLGDETALLRDALGSLKQGDGAEAIAKLDDSRHAIRAECSRRSALLRGYSRSAPPVASRTRARPVDASWRRCPLRFRRIACAPRAHSRAVDETVFSKADTHVSELRLT